MTLKPKILDVIACPLCKGKLLYDKNLQVLICKFNKVSFPIKDGVPMVAAQDAKSITEDHSKRSAQ